MEQDLKNWQKLWEAKKSAPLDLNKLITNINAIERKDKRERIALLIAIPITTLILLFVIPRDSIINYAISVYLIGIGMLMILIQLYKSKNKVIENEAELSNQEYTKNLIARLKLKMLTASRYMWIYTALLVSGINLAYIEILKNLDISLTYKIAIHVLLSAAIIFVMYLGIKSRKKKHKNEILPLIELLENIDKD